MSELNLVRVRAAPAYATSADILSINVDRQNLIIRNAVVMLANVEALGHGLMSDETTLIQTAALGNQRQNGTQGRLGHPGASDNAAGRQIFGARNFRYAGDRLLADLHMFEPARRSPAFGNDPIEWMLDMAEQHPEQLALSVVVMARAVWKLSTGDEIEAGYDGWYAGDEKPEGATTDLPLMRVESLHAVDLVNEGALTRGMFSPNEASFYAEGMFDFVDEWRRQFNIPLADVPRKVTQVLSRYLHARGFDPRKDDTNMAAKTATNTKSRSAALEDTSLTAPMIVDDELTGVNDEVAEPINPPPTPETAPAADPLAGAESTAAETEQVISAPPVPEVAPAETSADADFSSQVATFEARIAQLEAFAQDQTTTIERLIALMVKTTDNVAALAKDVHRIDGEPFVTESVPKARPIGQAAGKQTPNAAALKAAAASAPKHVAERAVNGGSNADQGLAVLLASAARSQK